MAMNQRNVLTRTGKRGDEENTSDAYPPMNSDEVDTSRIVEVGTVLSDEHLL